MLYRQGSVLESLRRAQDFLDTHAEFLGVDNKSGARRDLDGVTSALTALAVTQDGNARGSRGATAKQQRLRQTLRLTHMRPIAEIARQKLREVPEFKALGLPRQSVTPNFLVARAGGMADAATPYAQVFIDSGLDPDFLGRLRAAAQAVAQSIDERAAHRRVAVGSTAGLAAEERRGRSVLRVLDSILMPKLGDDAKLVGEWRSASRINHKTGVSGTKPSDTTSTTAGTATPAKEAVKEPAKLPAPEAVKSAA